MIKSEVYEKNIKFDKHTKLLIGIGDSFCAGTGSEDIYYWEKNNWDIHKIRFDIESINNSYANSFINILTQKYCTDYLPLNLGKAGKGNRHAIRELYSNPLLGIEKAGEKIVIFVSSGFERFDFSKDIVSVDEHTDTIWPYIEDKESVGYAELTFNRKSIYTEQLIVSEFIMDMYMLMSWCEINNAKLLFTSGFSDYLDRQKLIKVLINDRNLNNTDKSTLKLIINNSIEIVNKIPWHRQIKFENYNTMMDYMLFKQGRIELIGNNNFRDYKVERHSENDYISKCQHLTKKGHNLISDVVADYIKKYEELVPIDYSNTDKNFYKRTVI